MLLPKRVKYRRVHRGRMTGRALRGNKVTNGEYGLQALQPAWITSNQIEAARIAMTRYIKRNGKVWIKLFPDKPVTSSEQEGFRLATFNTFRKKTGELVMPTFDDKGNRILDLSKNGPYKTQRKLAAQFDSFCGVVKK